MDNNSIKEKLGKMYEVMPRWAKVTTVVVASVVTGASIYRLHLHKKKNKKNETTDEKVEE